MEDPAKCQSLRPAHIRGPQVVVNLNQFLLRFGTGIQLSKHALIV